MRQVGKSVKNFYGIVLRGSSGVLPFWLAVLSFFLNVAVFGLAGGRIRHDKRPYSAGRKAAFCNLLVVRPLRGRLSGLLVPLA